MCKHKSIHTQTCMYTHTNAYAHTSACAHTPTHTHMHAHKHTHKCKEGGQWCWHFKRHVYRHLTLNIWTLVNKDQSVKEKRLIHCQQHKKDDYDHQDTVLSFLSNARFPKFHKILTDTSSMLSLDATEKDKTSKVTACGLNNTTTEFMKLFTDAVAFIFCTYCCTLRLLRHHVHRTGKTTLLPTTHTKQLISLLTLESVA